MGIRDKRVGCQPAQYDQHHEDRILEHSPDHSKRSHAVPNNPRGRISSTTAIRMYIAMPDSSGANCTERAVTMPTRSPATIAPGYDPSPPMVTITKAGMLAADDIAGVTVQSGPASTPPAPARKQPSANAPVRTLGKSIPIQPSISGSRLPARKILP